MIAVQAVKHQIDLGHPDAGKVNVSPVELDEPPIQCPPGRLAGGVGGIEFYGVVKEELEDSGYPDIVWLTFKGRKEWALPKFLLPVYDLGDGELFCLDLRVQEGIEAQVVGFTPGYSSAEQNLDVVAEDFGKLFLDRIQLALKIKRT